MIAPTPKPLAIPCLEKTIQNKIGRFKVGNRGNRVKHQKEIEVEMKKKRGER
jgi:hypothetical protein